MGETIEFGVVLNTFQGEALSPDGFERIASAAEDFGFAVLWAPDHAVLPAEIPNVYPYSPDGDPGPYIAAEQDFYPALETLTYCAAVTDRIRIGTHVCVAPYRHPAALAKRVLAVDALSEGRLEFGVGAGWLPTEFELLDVPFDERGARLEEFLEVFRRACADGELAFDGRFHEFQRAGFHPQADRGRPRIWVGGRSGAAYRRIAEYGDGWVTVWDRPAAVRTQRDRILAAWNDYDRTGSPEIAVTRPIRLRDAAGGDRPLDGPAAAVIDDVRAYRDAGVTCLNVDFFTTAVDEQIEQLRRFAEDVMPAFDPPS